MQYIDTYIIENIGILSGVFFFVLSTALSIVLYKKSLKKVFPVYLLFENEKIASEGINENKVKLIWEGKEIPNLFYSRVVFFNKGITTIHKRDISEDIPITIFTNDDIKILGAFVKKKSRDTLMLDLKISEDKKSIYIYLQNDEAFEHNDGFNIIIHYTSKEVCKWILDGRKQCKSSQRSNPLFL